MKNPILNIFIALLATINIIQAQSEDKTLSPYFQIISENSATEQLPLKSTTADVNISGVIADVEIKQVYENTGVNPIEAIYVFPASTKAAVYDMEMRIGNRIIKAEIKEKGQARKEYTEAKKQGKRASLLEQERPNVFTMNVANILPGDVVTISLKYTESLIPEDGIYSFVYPTVVGPRYSGEQTNPSFSDGSIPHTKAGEAPLYNFDIDVNIQAGMALQDVSCSTHKINVDYPGIGLAKVDLDASENKGGNRDFVLEYQLAGNKINSGLLLYEGEDENYFMLTVQPPKKVEDKDITQREYIFVVDVSGSMNGFPLDVSKKLMRNLLKNLRPDDMFNVMTFAASAHMYASESVYAEEGEIERAIQELNQNNGAGGTIILNALNKAVNIPKCDAGLSRSIVVVTDGYISVEKEVFDLMRKYNNEFNFYSFGIGSSINRHLIEGMAHIGNSEPLFIKSKNEANEKAEKFRQYIAAPVLTDINVNWGDFDVYDLEPSNHSDVLAERPVVISGKYRGKPSGNIQLTGVTGMESYTANYKTSSAKPSDRNRGLEYLWARSKIRMLDDYIKLQKDDQRVKEVTALGLKHNLLTNYTSFVAIDHEPVVAANTPNKSVKQPLPLPKGVPNSAVGNALTYSSNPVNHGYGADLTISNSTGIYTTTLSYHVLDANLSSIENKFLEMEIGKQLLAMESTLDLNQIRGLELQLELDVNGQIVKVDFIKSSLSKEQEDAITKAIKRWNLIFRKNTNTRFRLTIA